MDKIKLLAMLASQAPQVLSALKGTGSFDLNSEDPSLNPIFSVGEALNRGYDMDLLADDIVKDNYSPMLTNMMPDPEVHDLGIVDYRGNPNFAPMTGPSRMWESFSKDNIDPEDWYTTVMNRFKKK